MAENRVLREQLGPKRIRFTDKQRRLLAEKGYSRIVGAMANLGHKLGRNTVKRILREAGVPPAPERRKGMPWKLFLSVHWDAIAAADFFSVEVLTLKGITRYVVFVVMELKTRRVEVAGIAHQPHGAWMMQVGRNLLDWEEGFLDGKQHLIVDRDPLFADDFERLLGDSDVELVRLPPRSPNLNCYIERFVRSNREECLGQMVVLGERHLRTVIQQYMEHFHEERNHQGLDNPKKLSRMVLDARLASWLREKVA